VRCNPSADEKLLERIQRDTAEVIHREDFLSTCYYPTHRPDKQPVIEVRWRADGGCGDNASLFIQDSAQGKLVKLLALKCVGELRQPKKEGSTGKYPDLLYVAGDAQGGGHYSAVFKFKKGEYQETHCRSTAMDNPGQRRHAKCDGRGLVQR
jgi:hypothetical protein